MDEVKVSVVITVFNESGSIFPLLQSLLKQTVQPNEVVIVDGGSVDKTVYKIKSFKKKHKMNICLCEEHGNISHGRNFGIAKAKNNLIALTDAGCLAAPDWLEKLIAPFKKQSDMVVAGFYEMKCESILQKALAPFLGVTKRKFDHRSFLPSARSVAFSKEVWSKAGGFDEKLEKAGEDTLFNYQVIKHKIPIIRVPEAKVYWDTPTDLLEAAKKIYGYAKGDAEAGIWWHPAKKLSTHNIKILTIYGRYALFSLLFLAGLYSSFAFFIFICTLSLYFFWPIWKLKEEVSDSLALLLTPIVQLVSDFSVMLGFISGMFSSSRKNV